MAGNDGIYGVYLAVRASLARAIMRMVPPRDVEDIVQETYVRVCQIESQGRSIDAPRAFLFKTARNLALDHLKRAETRLVTSVEDLPEMTLAQFEQGFDCTYEQAASDEEFSLFCRAVRDLPLQCRRVFVMKKVYGYSQREIARHFGLRENTVEKHIAEGIRRCSQFMQLHDINYRRGGKKTGKVGSRTGATGSGQ